MPDPSAPRRTGRYYEGGMLFEDGVPGAIEQGIVGGGENEDDRTNNVTIVRFKNNNTRVIGITETLVSPVPCLIAGVYANKGATPSTGYVSLRDAAATGGASTPTHEVDATGGVGANLHGAIHGNGLTVQGSAAATDITIYWRPIA